MFLPDFLRTSTFKLAATFAVTFAVSAALLFTFIYWQTALFETDRIDAFIAKDTRDIAGRDQADIERAVSTRILGDLHRITFAGLFAPDGHRLSGNLEAIPANLPTDGRAHPVEAARFAQDDAAPEAVRAVARHLHNGDLLVIGRNIDELEKLREVVLRALELGVIPATALSLAAGAFVSQRAQKRVKEVHSTAERIMYGDLRQRLPTRGTADDFDRLAVSVNLMLDEIGRLLDTVKAAGDDIAHDLRTPLARLRTRLERAAATARTREQLQDTVDSAIADLDQAMGLITTLLRIGEIEAGRQRAAFAEFDLAVLIDEVGQIYQPIAEEKGIRLVSAPGAALPFVGDRGLLLEAVANLVQNAIKFTQEGGSVSVAAIAEPSGPVVRVADNGLSIPAAERERVFDRFHRVDRSRHVEGHGLGLSLVASIAKLHGMKVSLTDAAPGCVFEIRH